MSSSGQTVTVKVDKESVSDLECLH